MSKAKGRRDISPGKKPGPLTKKQRKERKKKRKEKHPKWLIFNIFLSSPQNQKKIIFINQKTITSARGVRPFGKEFICSFLPLLTPFIISRPTSIVVTDVAIKI